MARGPTAAMDFFGHQDVARRRSSTLVFLYVLAVALIIVAIYFAFAFAFVGVNARSTGTADWQRLWNPGLFAVVAAATACVVLLGTLYKVFQLSQGGRVVAEILGGRLVNRNTQDLNERKLLNVVEEMAIASGTPVPPVYVLEREDGINAFAAGFAPSDAVVAVTRGCMENLSRDELQGVVAHEFSHILQGDMRLNIKLMGVLHGILVIALIGYVILRVAAGSGRRSSGKGKGGAAGVLIFGALLVAIGYIGVFFGKLIKSAVSRQREYLADASAVQFTRNPGGIAGALKKIGGYVGGSRLVASHAEEASHFYFANGLASSLLGLMATHPPLLRRIRRIEPSFDGSFKKYAAEAKAAAPVAPARSGQRPGPHVPAAPGFAPVADGTRFEVSPGEVVSSVGAPRLEHLEYAGGLKASLPAELAAAAEEPFDATALVYCLLLNRDPAPRRAQLEHLERNVAPAVYKEVLRLAPAAGKAPREARLPLVDLAIASLRQISENQYRAFVDEVSALVAADERVDLFEYVVGRMIGRHLKPSFVKVKPPAVQYYAINPLVETCGHLLSYLAHRGAADSQAAEQAFTQGAALLQAKRRPAITPAGSCSLGEVNKALDRLSHASGVIKRRVLEACTAVVASDGKVTVEEAELLRAVADSLDCPVPPFLQGQGA